MLPIVKQAGFDPVWFGIFLVLVVEMAQITPPVGFNLFVIQGLTGDGLGYIAKVTLPYLVIMVLFTLVITVFPRHRAVAAEHAGGAIGGGELCDRSALRAAALLAASTTLNAETAIKPKAAEPPLDPSLLRSPAGWALQPPSAGPDRRAEEARPHHHDPSRLRAGARAARPLLRAAHRPAHLAGGAGSLR